MINQRSRIARCSDAGVNCSVVVRNDVVDAACLREGPSGGESGLYSRTGEESIVAETVLDEEHATIRMLNR